VTSDIGKRLFSIARVDSPLPGDDDILRDATIQDVSQAVFSASPLRVLRGYISRPFNAELVLSVGNQPISVTEDYCSAAS
jgi:hypothetical protein